MAIIKLENPLDKFTSYSVQYIMFACRTTQDAKVFVDGDPNDPQNTTYRTTLDAIDKVTRLGEPISYNNRSDIAYLIMDTRRFAQFSIERLKYDVWIGAERGGSPANVTANVEMTVLDSVGISFINFLAYLMDSQMQCSFDGMIFMLRVIFVGHTADGETETVQTVSIPMHLFKMELNLDYAKGAYNIEFMPNINFDVVKHERWLNIYNATSYIAVNKKLGEMVKSFENRLNAKASEFFNNAVPVLSQLARSRAERGLGVNRLNVRNQYGRKVEYVITIPKEWEGFDVEGFGTGEATEIVHDRIFDKIKAQIEDRNGTTAQKEAEKKAAEEKKKEEAQKKKDAADDKKAEAAKEKPQSGEALSTTLAVQNGSKITDVLDIMFKQVPAIAELGAGKRVEGPDGAVTFYNHIVGITSDEYRFIVHINVIQYRVPQPLVEAGKKASTMMTDYGSQLYELPNGNGVRVPKNYIEYDYIFTGLNKDILNMDLKFQDLQWMLASNLEAGYGVMRKEAKEGQEDKDRKRIEQMAQLVMTRPYDPILLPKSTGFELDNLGDYSAFILSSGRAADIRNGRQDYLRNLSAFYAAAPITTAITIRGNPLIMQKFNMGQFMPHGITGGSSTTSDGSFITDRDEYRRMLEKRILRDADSGDSVPVAQRRFVLEGETIVTNSLGDTNYVTTPVFVKLNIKGPNVDEATMDLIDGGEYAREILMDNFFVVFSVSNLIEGSMFTQDITLYSHNIYGQGKLRGPGQNLT